MGDTGRHHEVGNHALGSHRLGPHVVGQRVVVRHLLPDGRATDVVGTCTSWGDDVVTIESDRGSVEVAVADIVTGKPVPPRASVRDRVSARDAELHGLSVFPGLETEALGEWILRSDPAPGERLFKRANSALAIGRPDRPFPDAVTAVTAFYAERDRPVLVQVEQESMTEHSLRIAGWRPLESGDTHFQVASTATVARALPSPPDAVRTTESGDLVLAELLDDSGAVIARGRAAIDDDWLALHALATRPDHRRRGLGRQVLAELLDWGVVRGARTAWLHVETDNAPALAFYESLGFRTHHSCRYLVP
jgi:ribosomal protein S18 acetylase RimI-like enzyme